MNGFIESLMFIVPLIYIAIIVMLFWLGFRFISAFETIAESLKKISEKEK